jgi:cytochrome c biogenesis protein CcmG/thiol:disulfide interchange protein DsbE
MGSNNNLLNSASLSKIVGDATDSLKWVDERLAHLDPRETWNPDFGAAQSRLRVRLAASNHNWSRMVGWSAILVTASLIVFFALTSAPTPRVLAQRCIACSIAIWQTISPSAGATAKLDPVNQRRLAEDFVLKDANGAVVRLTDLRGKAVVLNFWATWCGGCQVEIPWFVEFYKEYKRTGLEVIGVSLDDDGWKSVRPYLKEKSIPYRIVIANDAMRKELRTLPVTILIDREGRVAATHSGVPAKSTYEADIESLLK